MIPIAGPESSNDGSDQCSLGLESDARVGMVPEKPSPIVRALERFVVHRPRLCLGAAFSLGIALGWWEKRR
jgi:hypothetical protein